MNNYTRKKYPFKLGTTSYILPDDILPNVKYLTPLVDDIELVLFESPDFSNIPSIDLVGQYREYAVENNCGYTVHLPIDRKAGSDESTERKKFCETAINIIERTSLLHPHAWALHCEGITNDASPEQIARWQSHCLDVLKQLYGMVDNPLKIVVENLSYPAEWNFDIVTKGKCKCCLDIGHIWMRNDTHWEELCLKMLPETNVVHLHGVCDGNDHLSLRKGDPQMLSQFVRMLYATKYQGVVTLEVFSQDDFLESLELFDTMWSSVI